MKKILFPTDFSATAQNAFRYALSLADELGATIDLMTIYHLPASDASSVPPQYVEQMLEERRLAAEEKMKAFLAPHPKELIGKMRCDYGVFIYQEIIDAALHEGHDLIVMGTKGEHNAIEKTLGSVTTHTMMHASCPVLAVPAGVTYQPIGHIAYATDFQPTDEHAVGSLMTLAGMLGAAVHFLHVDTHNEDTIIEDEIFSGESPFHFTDFTVVSSPTVQEGVEAFIQKEKIQLLALFIPRRRFWERLFHSSFSKKMLFQSKIPLLTFHE